MIKKFLCIFILFFTTIQATYHQVLPPKPMVVVEIPIDTTYPEVKELLNRVPKEQQADFVKVLKDFADAILLDLAIIGILLYAIAFMLSNTESSNSSSAFSSNRCAFRISSTAIKADCLENLGGVENSIVLRNLNTNSFAFSFGVILVIFVFCYFV